MARTTETQVMEYIYYRYHWMTDPRHDGYSSWGMKQDLYQLQFALEEILKKSPKYYGEEEWIQEQRTQKALKELGYSE